MPTLKFIARDVYGVQKFYPANEVAMLFTIVAGTKTLTQETLRAAMQLGFTLEQLQRPVVLPEGQHDQPRI